MIVRWGWRTSRWRSLVRAYFKPQHRETALGIIYYESRGSRTARNPASDARGLFQHLWRYWPDRARAAGYAGASPYNARANIAVAAWLLYDSWDPAGAPHWHHWPVTYQQATDAIRRGHI